MKKSILLAMLWLTTLVAFAQDQDFSAQKSWIERKNREEKLQSNNTTVSSATTSNLSSVSVTSQFADTQAEARFAFNIGKSQFSAGLAQSFSSQPATVSLLDQDGITTGTTLSIAWQTNIGRTPIPSSLPIRNLAAFITVKEKVRARKDIAADQDVTFLDMDEEDRKELIEKGAINLDAFATPWFLTFKATATKSGFDYIPDSLSIRPQSSEKIGKTAGVSISKFKNLDLFYAFSYNLVVNYLSGDDVLNYTFPVGTGGLAFNKDVTIGEPARVIDSKLKAELRRLVRRQNIPFFGLNPSISWLIKRERVNVDLPFYFLTKREDGAFNGLQAGFRIGYSSRTDDRFFKDMFDLKSDKVYVGLFITKPFSVKQ